MFHALIRRFQLELLIIYFSTFVPLTINTLKDIEILKAASSKYLVNVVIAGHLSCRRFVVNTTFSTGLVGVEVTSVSWLGQLTVKSDLRDFLKPIAYLFLIIWVFLFH